jgi:hypothetical protein
MATMPMMSDCMGTCTSRHSRITNCSSTLVVGPDVVVWPDSWLNYTAIQAEVVCEPVTIGLTQSGPADEPPRHSPSIKAGLPPSLWRWLAKRPMMMALYCWVAKIQRLSYRAS